MAATNGGAADAFGYTQGKPHPDIYANRRCSNGYGIADASSPAPAEGDGAGDCYPESQRSAPAAEFDANLFARRAAATLLDRCSYTAACR